MIIVSIGSSDSFLIRANTQEGGWLQMAKTANGSEGGIV